MPKMSIQRTAKANAVVIWQSPEEWEQRLDALLLIPEEFTVMIQQGDQWIEVHKDAIDDLTKQLKALLK